MPVIACPHLGLDDDESLIRTNPSTSHRCYARKPPAVVDLATQEDLCLSGRYSDCLYCPETSRTDVPGQGSPRTGSAVSQVQPRGWPYLNELPTRDGTTPEWGKASPQIVPAAAASVQIGGSGKSDGDDEEERGVDMASTKWLWVLVPVSVIVGFAALFLAMGNEWMRTPATNPALLPIVEAATAKLTPAPPRMETSAPVDLPVVLDTAQPPDKPTPANGGRVVTLAPAAGAAGWWASGEQRGHLGDSFLYAGRYGGQEFLSVMRFNLGAIPRGAPLEQLTLQLSGLNADRLAAPDVGGEETLWLVQLIGEAGAPDFERGDYLAMLSAPAAFTLPPQRAAVLSAGGTNTFDLDELTRTWLARQLLDGATSVIVRLQTTGGTGDTLFAWDSGTGPETAFRGPELAISYGAPPPTPPPLPTKPFVVATLTPVPANALTVVAQAATTTAQATLIGTATELPFQVFTPTPFPENLETVQAAAAINGLPPVLLLTPAPANAATATEHAAYATAVALTTGTFTPVPTGFVTPIIIAPSPPAQNVATAAARVVEAKALAEEARGSLLPTPTPTLLPYNAVLGVYVYATPVFIPTNMATAVAYNKMINDAILATGTPTPLPWNALIITLVPTPIPPSPTPIPLFIAESDLTATPTPTPTGTVPAELPAEVRGKILFKSDRGGTEAVFMLDPSTDAATLITQPWVFDLAQKRLALSPDGAALAFVKKDYNGQLQIHSESLPYQTVRQVTGLGGSNYDPAWSPTGEWIAFVSTETGGDEIYRVDPTGQIAQRLTFNTWEWDKHPTWSPDGSQIVFYSNREAGRRQLWIMDADGKNQRNLSSDEYNDWDPIWVP